MGDAAISATIEVVLRTVTSLASDRIGSVLGFQKELDALSEYAKTIQGFLADADGKMHSPAVKRWLLQLEEEVFKAENVLDELNYENLRREVKYRNQIKKNVCFSFSFCNTIGFRSRLASKIRDINTNLDRIIGKANGLGLIIRFQIEAALPATAGASTSRQTDSIGVPNVVGRAEDESKIVNMLLSPSKRALSLLPIIGAGGLGKTTLAKSVYNNPQIEGHFNKRIWVCVAKQLEVMDLFRFILESLTRKKVELDLRDAIVQQIRQELGGERYFLVLDDVWNHEQGLWKDMLNTLEGLNPTIGSWCLVTTRLEQMAVTFSTHLRMEFDSYFLGKLFDEECWSIVKEKLMVGEQIPKELEAIKKQILRRCGGLPLAASLIGGLLLRKGKEDWKSIVRGSLLDGDQNTTKQILKVSFDHLSPSSVKKCFAYCSIFPQNTLLDKNLLIELWMAEGFLHLDCENERTMEDTGEMYFRILLQSSLLEKVRDPGRIYYKMHDLVHNFAESVLNPENSKRRCYLALDSFEGMAENTVEETSPALRTLFLERGISGDLLSNFEYLHVLKLSGRDVKVLPASIGVLIHLRFLDHSNSGIEILLEPFYKLYSLQTLRINVKNLAGLPKRMSNLISLRHVHTIGGLEKVQMPLEMGRLTCLVTLKFFNIGKEKGRRIEELGTLKHLKGSLVLQNLRLVNGKEEAKLANLCEKPNLSRLVFNWATEVHQDRAVNTYGDDADVLDGLQPNPNLQELEVKEFMGNQFPNWFINLSALKDLKLYNCTGCTELPALGQLPSLQTLGCIGLENIRSIGLSFYGNINIDDEQEGRGKSKSTVNRRFFPALKYLFLNKMSNLVEWKDADEVRLATGEAQVDLFPVLQSLRIEGCSQLTTAPSNFPSIKELMIHRSCHVLLVEKVLSNIINLSSLHMNGYGGSLPEDAQYISSLTLVERHGSNSSSLWGCGMLPSEMLERLCDIPSLEDLEVLGCSNLTSLRRSGCGSSIRTLKISNCHNLKEVTEDVHEFQDLQIMCIEDCPMIDLNKGKGCLLPSLECLTIKDSRGLNILPVEMLESFNESLRSLTLCCSSSEFDLSGSMPSSTFHHEFLPNLTDLKFEAWEMETLSDWIGNLASLESLYLEGCKKLRYLPSTAAMSRLTKLRSLTIYNCPLLEERCTPNSGTNSEWSKISYIPKRHIGRSNYIREF